MQRTSGVGHLLNKFNDRLGLTPGTVIDQKFLNTVQEELINLVSLCMSPIPPGTSETANSYRDNQLVTLINLIISGNWFISTCQVPHPGLVGSHRSICVNEGHGEVVICRDIIGQVNTIIGGDNNGIFLYPVSQEASNPRYWHRLEEGFGFRMIVGQGGVGEVNRVARQLNGGGMGAAWVDVGPNTGGGDAYWRGLATNPAVDGNWVICGGAYPTYNKVYYTTNNGASWTAATTSEVHTNEFEWWAAGYGNGRFMIAGQNDVTMVPLVYTSSDGGVTWTAATTPPGGNRNIAGVVYHEYPSGNAGEWIASMGDIFTTDDQYIWRSYDDGDTWSEVALPLATGEYFVGHHARTFNNIVFIPGKIVTAAPLSVPVLFRYVDPTNFSFVRIPTSDLSVLYDIAYIKGGYIMVGKNTTADNYESILRTTNIT